jgi:predicted phosphodiesterase
MKCLILTDIHSDYAAAQAAYFKERPDLVLDCGDHDEIYPLFEDTPHFYVSGNHEPRKIILNANSGAMPVKITSGKVFEFRKGQDKIRFAGIDGNYSSKEIRGPLYDPRVNSLKKISPGEIDILLTHESPLNVDSAIRSKTSAPLVIEEIKRISPKFVFSGHRGKFSVDTFNPSSRVIDFISLDSIANGYSILDVSPGDIYFRREQCYFQRRR